MHYAGSPFEIKELSDSGQIEGFLAGFGDVDLGGDRLVKGCFAKSLASRTAPLPMLLHHDRSRPIGAWKAWEERSEGLYVKGSITLASRDGQEAHALARDGALSGLSVGWLPKRQTTDQVTGVRTITEADLFEGSLVTVPMNPRAQVANVKSVITGAKDLADLLVEQAGWTRARAKVAAGGAWKALQEQQNDDADDAELAALITNATARLTRMGVR